VSNSIEAHTASQNRNTSKSPSPLRPYENRFENTLTPMKHESNKRSPIPGFIMRAGSYGSTWNLLELGTSREKMSEHWGVSFYRIKLTVSMKVYCENNKRGKSSYHETPRRVRETSVAVEKQ